MKLKAITVIDDGSNKIKPGAIFERPKKEAAWLIDCGAAAEVATVKVVDPDPNPGSKPDPDPDPDKDGAEGSPEDDDEGSPEPERDPLTGLPTS